MTSIAHTTNPYAVVVIPAIGRVLDAITQLAADLGARTIQVSNRTLARAAGLRSASQLPEILRQLDADGHISYDPTVSMVMVITGAIDQGADRPDADLAPQCAPAERGDQDADRSSKEVGLMNQEEEGRAHARDDRPVVGLLRADKAQPSVIRRILAAIPDLTPERYLAEKGWWRRFKAGKTIGYLFGVLMNGSTLAPENPDDQRVPSTQRRATTDRRERHGRGAGRADADDPQPALDRAAFQALPRICLQL